MPQIIQRRIRRDFAARVGGGAQAARVSVLDDALGSARDGRASGATAPQACVPSSTPQLRKIAFIGDYLPR